MASAATNKVTGLMRAIVVGLGKTGYACAVFLLKQGADVVVIDDREQPPYLTKLRDQYPTVGVYLGSFDAAESLMADVLVVSPGVSWREPFIQKAMQQGKRVISDIQLFADYVDAPVVAITGSNGKSTVTTLFGQMVADAGFRVAVGGNLGTPAVDLLCEPAPDFYVLELSSFQLDLTSCLPLAAAVVLNISEDHMDRYEGIAEYAASKARIYQHAAVAVVNLDDAWVPGMSAAIAKRISFSRHQPQKDEFGIVGRAGEAWLAQGSVLLLRTQELQLDGLHNQLNVLAALALGVSIGLPMARMLETAKRFSGLPHRCQLVRELNGVKWVNDSKATNVGAAAAAIAGMAGKIVLIAGGDAKGADFTLFRPVVENKVVYLILLGRDAGVLEAALQGVVMISRVCSMQEAVDLAKRKARPGETVLLAPACSSLDMYQNYEARGEDFVSCVQRLAGGVTL